VRPEEYAQVAALVAAARDVLRDARLLPFLVLPMDTLGIPCRMPEEYTLPKGCDAMVGEPCRGGTTCKQRVICFESLRYAATRPSLAFECPACRAVVGQYCIKTLWPETFEPAHDHTHPSRRRLGDALRVVRGCPPLGSNVYEEWVRGDRWKEEWTRSLAEAHYLVHYGAGTPAELEEARRVVATHEALPAPSDPTRYAPVKAPAARPVLPARQETARAPPAVPPPKGPRQATLDI